MEKELIYLCDSHDTQLCAIDVSKVSYVGKLNDTCIELIIDGCRQIVDHGTAAVRDAGYDYVIRFMQSKPTSAVHSFDKLDEKSIMDRLTEISLFEDCYDDLSFRTRSVLKNVGILTAADLVKCSQYDLLKIRGFGKKALREVNDLIESLEKMIGCSNLALGMAIHI